MKHPGNFALLTLLLVCIGCSSPRAETASATASRATPPRSATALPAAPSRDGDALLALVHRCARELFPKGLGVGGNRLRYDAMSLHPHQRHFRPNGGIYSLPEPSEADWRVRVEEEHPHNTIPNGIEYGVNVDTQTCSHVIMD